MRAGGESCLPHCMLALMNGSRKFRRFSGIQVECSDKLNFMLRPEISVGTDLEACPGSLVLVIGLGIQLSQQVWTM